ncbi:hypothetical protein DIURU_001777 [Diutina rugosa]|uniref:Fatty acid hydroxylase domain-containing protein n=1 Tax=Diutina rugosa TaxID=5481 RepID=A0A642UXU8_DIURU|nr:uncharacterized protein DIURU_001777 [Diutina rugosa]KAA8904941.1 hypothetical protein DIURU_001777 [Diutina rugosa]
MDIVLEIVDYYVFDRVYATIFPKSGALDTWWNSNVVGSPLMTQLESAAAQLKEATLLSPSNAFNTTMSFKSAISSGMPLKVLANKIANYQNDDIYGAPRYLPPGPWMDKSMFARDNLFRESINMFITTAIFGWLLYFSVATISYFTVFDKKIFNHPRYLKNQMRLEMGYASRSIPVMVLLTLPFFILEINGFSKLYLNIDETTGGWSAVFWQIPKFIMFTDCGIYYIHRFLHRPSVYKRLHKPHHKWIVCTPYASHAFHPVDGWAQSLPYHIYPMLFPLQKVSYLLLFTFVNFWTVMIHDGQYLSNDPVVNGTACHTIHHLYFNYNYGQFTTLWDRLGGSYRRPDDSLFERNQSKDTERKVWKEQVEQMEEIRGELEGKSDFREYVEST